MAGDLVEILIHRRDGVLTREIPSAQARLADVVGNLQVQAMGRPSLLENALMSLVQSASAWSRAAVLTVRCSEAAVYAARELDRRPRRRIPGSPPELTITSRERANNGSRRDRSLSNCVWELD